MYASPLNTIIQIIQTRSAASIYWPLSLAATINCFMWVSYGIVIGDPFYYVPSGLSACFGLVQLALKLVLRSSASRTVAPGEVSTHAESDSTVSTSWSA